jgi:hypothetical protein
MSEPDAHRLAEVRPTSGRGQRGFLVHCSCGWISSRISTPGMATSVHERHRANPDIVDDPYY